MANLRAAPPRPRPARVSPSYPRAVASLATFAVLLAGCGGVVENQAKSSDPDPAGGISIPFDDGGTRDDAADAADAPKETEPQPLPEPAGAAPYPYEDSGPLPGEDTGALPAEDGGPATDPAPVDAGPAPSPPEERKE